ncbi:MAG: hypothetical protein PHN31_04735, partial [Candidatus Gracilibacteria bacterium]|nr:hypothetical protein [Candidatus Gracilibacteria bacterium]
MLKKLIKILILISIFFTFTNTIYSAGSCSYGGDPLSSLEGCVSNTSVIQTTGISNPETWFKDLMLSYIGKISTVLAVVAIGSIAYGSMMMVISGGNDDKIKKGRKIIQWALIGLAL